MNYSIIKDEKLLREFITWLPNLLHTERYYLALFARKKYCNDIKYIKTDKAQCGRWLVTKETMFNKIRQMECPVGSFEIKGISIPQEALALYVSVNPRDLYLATKNSLIKLATLLTQEYNGYNPHAEVMSEVHRARGRKLFMDFDFDNVSLEVIRDQVKNLINTDCLTFIKTKNGFHMLVELKKVDPSFNKTWYRELTSLEGADVVGDNLVNVCGTYQGGYTPHFC